MTDRSATVTAPLFLGFECAEAYVARGNGKTIQGNYAEAIEGL